MVDLRSQTDISGTAKSINRLTTQMCKCSDDLDTRGFLPNWLTLHIPLVSVLWQYLTEPNMNPYIYIATNVFYFPSNKIISNKIHGLTSIIKNIPLLAQMAQG